MQGILGKLSLGLAALLLCFVIGEVAVRSLDSDRQLEFEVDDQLYWRFAPSQVGYVWMGNAAFHSPEGRINNIGTRGPDVDMDDEGVVRVLMLGDSYTFGSGVRDEETFSAVLQRALGSTIEVINAGGPGYGIFQEERLLQRLGPLLRPQVVVVTVPTGDISRQPFPSEEEERAYLVTERRRIRLRQLSRFAALLYRRYYSLRARYLTSEAAVPNHAPSADSAAFLELWTRDRQRLSNMARLCRSWQGRLVVVAWPQGQHAERDAALIDGVRRLAEREGILGLVDLGEALASYSKNDLEILGDGHPSPLAHQLVGQYLATALAAQVPELGRLRSSGVRD